MGLDARTASTIQDQKAALEEHVRALRSIRRFEHACILVIVENNLKNVNGYLATHIHKRGDPDLLVYHATKARDPGIYKSSALTIAYREETDSRIRNHTAVFSNEMITCTPRFHGQEGAKNELFTQARRMTIVNAPQKDGTVARSFTGKGASNSTNDDLFIAFAMACMVPGMILLKDPAFFRSAGISC